MNSKNLHSRHLLYLHGFLSSPTTPKAQALKQFLLDSNSDVDFLLPQLPCLPGDTIQYLRGLVAKLVASDDGQDIALVGSSLGAYYALNLAAEFGLRAVLINPAIRPFELFAEYRGEVTHPYTGEVFTLDDADLEKLLSLHLPPKQVEQLQDRLLLLLQSGDETLDYRQAATEFSHCRMVIEYGGSHSFDNFARWIPELLAFLWPQR